MSQSRPGEFDHHGEPDPLLAFSAEFAAAESARKSVDPTAASKADDAAPLRLRLDQAERSLERARTEIAALKSNLATLVTAIEEIKKRLSRRPEAVPFPRPVHVSPGRGLLKIAAVVILCLTLGAAAWSLASGVESASSRAPSIADPAAAVPAPAELDPLIR